MSFERIEENNAKKEINFIKFYKLILQINFIWKLEDQNNGATMFFIIEKSEENTLKFLQNSVNIL